MHKLLRLFGASVSGLGAFAIVSASMAADPARGGTAFIGRSAGRVGMAQTTSARMPTMPILPGGAVGNVSSNVNPTPAAPTPDNPDNPDTPDTPSECADGGVANSDYTVDKCMNDVLACVNGGALPGGMNDLFNEDLRNSIMNGMGLCAPQVERCVTSVRKNCSAVYRSSSDVWVDFNSRKIQPEYYNFVLRKTGLTPNQAENTCLLLDRNTYGSSFAAVSKSGDVTTEYGKNVGAYNGSDGNSLQKTNPMGVTVNTSASTVDGARGHYARWDATTATCLVRVAAYNKDKQITNTWVFGALGDDKPAEVWKSAGDSFSCNKNLFGFSLMNKTSTAAVVGVGGGTLLGAGVGAIAGHGKRDFDCSRPAHRKELAEVLKQGGRLQTLNGYLVTPISSTGEFDEGACTSVVELFDRYERLVPAVAACAGASQPIGVTIEETSTIQVILSNKNAYKDKTIQIKDIKLENDSYQVTVTVTGTDGVAETKTETIQKSEVTTATDTSTSVAVGCSFKTLKKNPLMADDIRCASGDGVSLDCLNASAMERQLAELKPIWDAASILKGEDSNMGASIGIGAAVGAGAGGVSTAITAFIERNNISCRVGDDLATVGYGKSYKIDTLKDFYVKWNLNLPDTVAPTVMVSDCQSWRDACARYTDLNQCASARVNFRNAGGAMTTVESACMAAGSTCVENYTVAKSQGMCE